MRALVTVKNCANFRQFTVSHSMFSTNLSTLYLLGAVRRIYIIWFRVRVDRLLDRCFTSSRTFFALCGTDLTRLGTGVSICRCQHRLNCTSMAHEFIHVLVHRKCDALGIYQIRHHTRYELLNIDAIRHYSK